MKKSFTLIELLIVIAIIAILASMLLPALNKARAKTRTVKCVSNQKQCLTAAMLYADDYGDHFTTYSRARYWPKLLLEWGYLNNIKVMGCPENPHPVNVANMREIGDPAAKEVWDYGAREILGAYSFYAPPMDDDLKNNVDGKRDALGDISILISSPLTYSLMLKRIKRPSSMELSVDAAFGAGSTVQCPYAIFTPHAFYNGATRAATVFLHNNRTVAGYADGHVVSRSWQELKESPMRFKVGYNSLFLPIQ